MEDETTKPPEFHLDGKIRSRLGLSKPLEGLRPAGSPSLNETARLLAWKINGDREPPRAAARPARPGELTAIALLHAVFHHVMERYRREQSPGSLEDLHDHLEETVGPDRLESVLQSWPRIFPPDGVFRGDPPASALAGETGNVPNRLLVLEEILLLWVVNRNPALGPYRDLIDETPLEEGGAYRQLVDQARAFYETRAPIGPEGEPLMEMLLAPARIVPHSLAGQLEYIRTRWGDLLGEWSEWLLRGVDLLREEALSWKPGGADAAVYDYAGLEDEPEGYSADLDWMPEVVLVAKHVLVWLHQLSRAWGREIHRLDQVPDEELDRLARWGFNALWLIGCWERSPASRTIKRMCGNSEASASAYAVYAYEVARDLGGEEAFWNLKSRAGARGIRMATDMVPNHTGIDARWVIEHPERYLALERCPFPAYRFDGPDLSGDENVDIRIESHYFERTDAAVVFRRQDRRSGEEGFLYHGNDGTGMPWNDTAQLDHLKPEVREALIQEILAVARRSPIIRFDAAMTLTKRHYRRLWFPAPGEGGAIPTRGEHGLSRGAFHERMPVEFWREVVDRVRIEAPGTLLLAEAFWLMEGYFVRTLGMHRVYNSAFMNMLKEEKNANYRSVMKNTLAFDPQVMQRFVNFMSNPDEDTAVAQFGKWDKYFGVCLLMATLPGLPMFAHGQVEGFEEKYGMEYARAYREEVPDEGLILHHERVIFPLLRRRRLFARAEHFLLYDFFTAGGRVNEDVFAYSNRHGRDRVLVVYHNRFGNTAGWIRTSTAFASKRGGETVQDQRTLAEGLGLSGGAVRFCIFRDHVSGLEYIRCHDEIRRNGLYVQMEPYGAHVFLDFREVDASDRQPWDRLAAELDGQGVRDMDARLKAFLRRPLIDALRNLASLPLPSSAPSTPETAKASAESFRGLFRRLLDAARRAEGTEADATRLRADFEARAAALQRMPDLVRRLARGKTPARRKTGAALDAAGKGPAPGRRAVLVWLFLEPLGGLEALENRPEEILERFEAWDLGAVLTERLREAGSAEADAWKTMRILRILVRGLSGILDGVSAGGSAAGMLAPLLEDEDVRALSEVEENGERPWVLPLLMAASIALVAQADPSSPVGEETLDLLDAVRTTLDPGGDA